MKILYISGLCSPYRVTQIYEKTGKNPGFAMQKFNRLVAEGLDKNGCQVSTLSAPPISSSYPKKFFLWRNDNINNIKYHYIPFINLVGIRQICLFFYTFFYVIIWGLNGDKNKIIVCDLLAISINLATVFASKIIRIQNVGILTDMPGLMVNNKSNISLKNRIISDINKSYLSSFDFYVFLTKYMNESINVRHRPYIVMEGVVDSNISLPKKILSEKRRIVYAGGLYEEYGILMLIKAFMSIPNDDIILDLFGEGPIVPWILEQANIDSRIIYHGVKSNSEVFSFECNAFLLVNPRPTHEAFTKFSFPSKNMEYMSTGTAVLTTKLPGMPCDYYPYVYLFKSETIAGYCDSIIDVLKNTDEEISEKGALAFDYISNHKNNIVQTKRILELIKL